MIVYLKMNKQDLLYTNLPQYKFKNIFLYMLLFKLLQFIKPLEFCLNKLNLKFSKNQLATNCTIYCFPYFSNRVDTCQHISKQIKLILHPCPFLYHFCQELNKKKKLLHWFWLKINSINHCITLLKIIFSKYI